MKKIAILINSNKLGGAEKVVQTIINNILTTFDVHLILLEKNNFFEFDKRVNIHYLSENQGTENKLIKLFNLLLLAIKLKKYLIKHNITIVQSNLYRANYVNILAKLLGSQHIAQLVDHSLSSRLIDEGLSGNINMKLIKYLYPLADMSIAVSVLVQHQLEVITVLPKRKTIINNPFDLVHIREKAMHPVEDFLFESDTFYIILVGRLNSIKNYQLVIKSLNKIKNKNIKLLIVGKEEDISITELYNLSYEKLSIHYLAEKINPFPYIKQSDLLIVSSNSESFGNVLVESMICGTPIISTDCGGPREIIAPNTNVVFQLKKGIEKAKYGLLYAVNDEQALAECIKLLYSNRKIQKSYAEIAKKRAKDFSVEKIVEKYKEVLELE